MTRWRRYVRYRRDDGALYDTWFTEGMDETFTDPSGMTWRLVATTLSEYRSAADAADALDAVCPSKDVIEAKRYG